MGHDDDVIHLPQLLTGSLATLSFSGPLAAIRDRVCAVQDLATFHSTCAGTTAMRFSVSRFNERIILISGKLWHGCNISGR